MVSRVSLIRNVDGITTGAITEQGPRWSWTDLAGMNESHGSRKGEKERTKRGYLCPSGWRYKDVDDMSSVRCGDAEKKRIKTRRWGKQNDHPSRRR